MEKRNNKKYVLITGACGLIGSQMADWILDNKDEYGVIGIDNLFGGYRENLRKEAEFYQRDIAKDDIKDIFDKFDIEYVYHFAAYAAEGLSPFMRRFNWLNNSVSTANIINECITHDVKRLVYTSSMSVYGHGDMTLNRFCEDDRPNPIDPYGISKYACEMDIKVAHDQHGLDYCIIRPHNFYGPKQNIWDKYRNVLGIWMYQVLHDEPMLIYGDGTQTRAFSYIKDALEPLWNAATLTRTSGQTINLGGVRPYTINEAANILSSITGYSKIEHREQRHEVKWAVPTYEKSMELLSFNDKTPLEEGLRNMWEWAKEQPDRKRYQWGQYEITKGIYSYWK